MTRTEAAEIRATELQGGHVDADLAAQARDVLSVPAPREQMRKGPPIGTTWIRRPETKGLLAAKERTNRVLLKNLQSIASRGGAA